MAAEVKPAKVPRWNDDLTNQTEPTEGKKDVGWVLDEEPASSFFNFLQHFTGQWFKWLNQRVFDGATAFDLEIQGVDADAGVDQEGGDFTLSGGDSTGDGGSELIFQVALRNQGTGSTPRVAVTIGGFDADGVLALLRGFSALGVGSGSGVEGTGGTSAGTGVKGTGGAGGGIGVDGLGVGPGGVGIKGTGGTSGAAGVDGFGGSGNGPGVQGKGSGTGPGVNGIGLGGPGVEGSALTGGIGVKGTGAGVAAGDSGIGGDSSGVGVTSVGGVPNGVGARGTGTGTGIGVHGTSAGTGRGVVAQADTTTPVSAALRVVPQDTDPSSLLDGDMWVNSTGNTLKVRLGGVTKTVTVT